MQGMPLTILLSVDLYPLVMYPLPRGGVQLIKVVYPYIQGFHTTFYKSLQEAHPLPHGGVQFK